MLVLGEENFKDICCKDMITALKKEAFWAEERSQGIVFGFESIKWDQDAGEYIVQNFLVVDFCPFCSTKIEYALVAQ